MRLVRIALALLVLTESGAALAHARLQKAMPAAGATLAAAPKEVALTFTEAIEPKFSTIKVVDEKGAEVQVGSAEVGSTRSQLHVGLKPLGPGMYNVIWRVLSVDTHRTQGSFTFRVGR